MPYNFKEENGKVAAVDKKTGKISFHADSMEQAKHDAHEREVHEHANYHLKEGSSQETISQNIKTEREHGHPEQQAIAIAESEARKSKHSAQSDELGARFCRAFARMRAKPYSLAGKFKMAYYMLRSR